MKLHGLQKMTLLDFPEHVACTVFLGGCDYRCPFCHNYELVDGSAPPVPSCSPLPPEPLKEASSSGFISASFPPPPDTFPSS